MKALLLCSLLVVLSIHSSHAQAPANDDFANAVELVGDPAAGAVTATGTNIDATKQTDEPNHAGSLGGASVWFRWTAPNSGPIAVDLTASSFDTIFGVYTGNAVNDLELVIFNDDGDQDTGVGVGGKAVFNVTADTTYQIGVDGFPDTNAVAAAGDISISITTANPPSNDDFANAIQLGSVLPTARLGDPHRDSTIEAGEPSHSQFFGFGTTWYRWTAPVTHPVEIAIANGTARPSLVAVYTGSSLATIDQVGVAITSEANGAQFLAVAGVEYRIAVVGLYSSGAQTRGEISLIIQRTGTSPVDALRFGSDWEWLNPGTIDPAIADADFATTWHTGGAGYNGPAFSAAAPAPLGYGAIIYTALATDIGASTTAAYFRREFTLDEEVVNPVIELLADDGAIIYIDGSEVARHNVTGEDTHDRLADSVVNTEDRTYRLRLPALDAGTHTVAVSLHNVSTTSSDLGFDLQLLAATLYNGEVTVGREPLCIGFEDSPAGSQLYLGRSQGDELGWRASAGNTFINTDGEVAFQINDLDLVTITSERIAVNGNTGLVASFDMRTRDTSSGFEATDFLQATVEGSYDGLIFSPVADIFPRLTGGDPDPFAAYQDDTDYTSFTTQLGDIPDGLTSVRLVIEAAANSGSEFIILDNLCIVASAAQVEVLDFTATPAGGATLVVRTEPGHLYELQQSSDLGNTETWTLISSETANGEQTTLIAPAPLAAGRQYFRVVDRGED